MEDPRQRHGNHTWDIILHYYRCPQCGLILENRDKFERRHNRLEKDLICHRCQTAFTVTKQVHPTFGPLLGHNQEVDE